ncbi:uncharacterized protein LOC110913622 [Helianthus annuus]|uniref:uncharacterized protein LOC110913622 n=1 Tax=Helianthus annuus TaxID=4232 RepID=UPI000B8FAF2A|nr:uncharacterized protein LOC110913622 [Helianthus annuus]
MYNPGWRNHPNFGWKANSNNQNPLGYAQRAPAPQQSQGQSFQPQGQSFQPSGQTFQPRYNNLGSGSTSQPQTSHNNSKLEEMMVQLLNNSNNANQITEKQYQQHEERFMAQEGEMRSQKASIQTIENQVGQLAKMLSERPQGSLPGNTEPNLRGHVNAVMTRSGKTMGPDKSDSPPISDMVQTDASDEVQARRVPASTTQFQEPVKDFIPHVPYPSRLKKQKNDEQHGMFLEMFKQLHINIPFVEALAQMPKYARFLKDILTNKQKLESLSCVLMNENCSALLQNCLPEKMGDPGSFTLTCLIGSMSVSHALADLGASINLMSYKVFAKLDLGEPSPTRMSIRLADHMDEDSKVPLILGRPFLNTARTIVDVVTSQITLRVNYEHVNFDIKRSMQHPQSHDDMLYYVDIVDTCVSSHFQGTIEEIDTDTHLLCENQNGILQEGHETEQPVYQIGEDGSQSPDQFMEIDREVEEKSKPSVEDPPSLELKELTPHHEYAFLDEECRMPLIISASLVKKKRDIFSKF